MNFIELQQAFSHKHLTGIEIVIRIAATEHAAYEAKRCKDYVRKGFKTFDFQPFVKFDEEENQTVFENIVEAKTIALLWENKLNPTLVHIWKPKRASFLQFHSQTFDRPETGITKSINQGRFNKVIQLNLSNFENWLWTISTSHSILAYIPVRNLYSSEYDELEDFVLAATQRAIEERGFRTCPMVDVVTKKVQRRGLCVILTGV